MSSAAALVQLSGTGPRPARADVQVARVLIFDTSAWIAFRYDQAEAARRAESGLGAVPAWDVLDTLMDLPAGLPVPVVALSQSARRRLGRAPAGVTHIDSGEVIRDLVPAVTPLLAVIIARDWASGLARASRFAPYCRRMVVGQELTGAGGEIVRTASRLGIGVAVRSGPGAADVLLEPEPVTDWQPTTAWWRFCEVVYGHAARAAG
jgi:hypothetical protein